MTTLRHLDFGRLLNETRNWSPRTARGIGLTTHISGCLFQASVYERSENSPSNLPITDQPFVIRNSATAEVNAAFARAT